MEFGRVSPEELDRIDFSLPADSPDTTRILAKGKNRTTEIFVGCAKWGRKDWVGKVYPKGTKDADFLEHYARHFNCIELNATFYRMPTRAQTENWKSKVGPDFQFCPKLSDKITHMRRMKDVQSLTDRFLEAVSGFGSNLGPIFIVPHPQMGPKSLDTIQAFVEALPKDLPHFIELRHEKWFEDKDVFNDAFNRFERAGTGAVITDASGRRDCVHMRLTTSSAFIRFVGNGLHPTNYKRVADWVSRIQSWMNQGIQKVYFFMHQHEELHSPELCKYVIQQMNTRCGTTIAEPVFISDAEPLKPVKKAPRKKAST